MHKTIFRLKRFLGSKVDLLEFQALLEKESSIAEDFEKYKKYLQYKDKVSEIINSLYETLDKACQDGLSLQEISKLIKA